MSWRDEISTVLEAWIAELGGEQGRERWQRVGTARPTGEPGAYAVDIRGSDLTADQADNLRLAGPEERNVWGGFPVMEATVDGELLRVRVAEFAAPEEPYVWRLRPQPTFLITALRDGLAALTDAGLANLLARGEVGGVPAAVSPPPLLPAQQDAYRACLGSGLRLVWGPPGTGKTRLLQAAISDMIAAGKRVLLVSGTNIAVDNALLGVVRERRHQPGEIVRVGPPQLREIADDPQVCLPLMVRARLAEVEEQRRTAAMDLLEMDRRNERLRNLEARLTGFDVAAYEAAAALLAEPGRTVAETSSALAECELVAEHGLRAIEDGRNELAEAASVAAEVAPARKLWAQIENDEAELARVQEAARQAEARALVAENTCVTTEEEIAALRQPGGRLRWRDRSVLREAQRRLDATWPECDRLRAAAARARSIADAFRHDTEVRRVSRNSGWWAAGLLLARALVELHVENGETTGVVTPYTAQAEATLEALRDVEPGGRPLAEVGTAHRFQGREFPIVVFDTVEPWHDGGLWMGQASRLPGSTSWQQNGVRLFNVATTRAQHRLYVIASRDRIRNARPGTAFGHLGVLLGDRTARSVPATGLVTPLEFKPANLGPEGRRLAEVLARHVEITDVHDENSFYDQFARLISQAQNSIWLWSAWAATRVYKLLPLLKEAVDRGVRVTVFVRDPSDTLQRRSTSPKPSPRCAPSSCTWWRSTSPTRRQ